MLGKRSFSEPETNPNLLHQMWLCCRRHVGRSIHGAGIIQYFAGIHCHWLAMGRGSREAAWLPWMMADPIASVGDWFVALAPTPEAQVRICRLPLHLLYPWWILSWCFFFPIVDLQESRAQHNELLEKMEMMKAEAGPAWPGVLTEFSINTAIVSQRGGEWPTVCVLVGVLWLHLPGR